MSPEYFCPDGDMWCPYYNQMGICTISETPWEDCDTWYGIDPIEREEWEV